MQFLNSLKEYTNLCWNGRWALPDESERLKFNMNISIINALQMQKNAPAAAAGMNINALKSHVAL